MSHSHFVGTLNICSLRLGVSALSSWDTFFLLLFFLFFFPAVGKKCEAGRHSLCPVLTSLDFKRPLGKSQTASHVKPPAFCIKHTHTEGPLQSDITTPSRPTHFMHPDTNSTNSLACFCSSDAGHIRRGKGVKNYKGLYEDQSNFL